MKIACLQFDSQVGDVDDNLNRADAVLDKIDPEDLDSLDLLVLPELAFSGYNFKSLQHIAPCLEEAGSGITSLWAQTTALKHDCTVVVGYPEKVDVSANWPASPEYYNSALAINGDGDTVGNYRKSFLFYTDETWALEGGNGFFKGEIAGLGNVALGIGTDLNPYKLEAPWDAFEFGFHVSKAQANVVIVSMAWQTHQDPDVFGANPAEPDIETLVYWVQRLEPLIRADKEEEVIVVFCNRAGSETEATYTGTSAVIGIKRGEVFVYGVLGRGVDDLLIVDTDQPPMSKLTDADAVERDDILTEKPTSHVEKDLRTHQISDNTLSEESEAPCYLVDSGLGPELNSPQQPTSPKLPWLAQIPQPGDTPTDTRSPTRLQIPTSPTRLQIPTRPQFDEYITIDSAISDDVIIDTPAVGDTPALDRRLIRPKLANPSSPWRFPSKQSPYPWHHHDGSHSSVFGAGAAMTPITPFDEDGWSSTPIEQKAPPQWFWKHEPTLSALKESIVEEDEEEPDESPNTKAPQPGAESEPKQMQFETENTVSKSDNRQEEEEDEVLELEPEATPLNDWAELADVLGGLKVRPGSAFDFRSSHNDRPSSPKSRYPPRDTSPIRLFQPSELSYGEQEQTAWGMADSDPTRSVVGNVWGDGDDDRERNALFTFARPSSRASHRSLQRGHSFDNTSGNGGHGQWASKRQPSRLRHAIFADDVADEIIDDEPDYDSPDDDYSPRRRGRSRGRQPSSHPPTTLDQQQPPPQTSTTTKHPTPLSIDPTIATNHHHQHQQATTPSLCSATSATSTTSVSTFADSHLGLGDPVLPRVDAGDEEGLEDELVPLGGYAGGGGAEPGVVVLSGGVGKGEGGWFVEERGVAARGG
ncbi:carbon-nitrogen hydrolase [Chaetomium tenue]|uniref:Carbon-nitrogen hydrolase n=1 Tax=Chaetomium tenue TaxID=1854479 RepID=A0ACB7PCL9_9PEZI|nr:carbon-nitrogen hydrolase [Chaetomium globosum]